MSWKSDLRWGSRLKFWLGTLKFWLQLIQERVIRHHTDPKCEAWAFGSHGSLSPITVTAKHKRELCLDQSWKPTTVNIVTLLWKNGHTGNRNKCDMLSHKQTHTPTYGHSRGLEVAAFSQLIDLKVEWHSHRRAHTRKRTQTHIRQLWELVEVNLGGQAFHSLPAETKHPTPSPSLTCRAFFSLPYLPPSDSLFLCYPAGLRHSVFSLLVLSRLHASARRKLLYKLGIQKNGNTCKSNKAPLQPVKLHQCWGGYVHSVQSQRSLWCCCLGCITDRERKSCILKTPECITHTSLINTWGGIRSVFFNCIYRPDPDIMLAPVSLLWA